MSFYFHINLTWKAREIWLFVHIDEPEYPFEFVCLYVFVKKVGCSNKELEEVV